MPLVYPTGIIKEHRHTRNAVSLFDTCHMGEFRVSGRGAAGSLDYLLARPVSNQAVGSCRYNFLLNESGGVQDDLVVYRIDEQEYILVVNAGTRDADAEWLRRKLDPAVEFFDKSLETGKLDLQGPLAADVLVRLCPAGTELPEYYRWKRPEILGDRMLVSRTGYTGELGFELYLPWDKTPLLWERLLREKEVCPAGLGARDTLRLEMGFPLYGHELGPDTTPVEAGFGSLIAGGRSFVGDVILKKPPGKQLTGLMLEGRRASRQGASVFSYDLREIGRVTSGSFAPALDTAVALAYIDYNEVQKGLVEVLTGDPQRPFKAVIVDLPFYRGGSAKKNVQAGGTG
jgi:aminomethyltransferase